MGKNVTVQGADGVELWTTVLEPTQTLSESPKGTIFHVHGLSEYSTRYQKIFQRFVGLGFRVVTMDHRGHGRSGGSRGCLKKLELIKEDVARVWKAHVDPTSGPVVAFGHSMGGMVVTALILEKRISPDALLLSSPAFSPGEGNPPLQGVLARLLSVFSPCMKISKRREGVDLTRVEENRENYKNDPLVNHFLCPSSHGVIFHEGAYVLPRAHELELPVFIFYGGADRVCNPAAMRQFYQSIRSTEKKEWVDSEGLHETLFDTCSEKVQEEIQAWLLSSPWQRSKHLRSSSATTA